MYMLDPVVVHPSARPPPESRSEIKTTGILQHCSGRYCVYTDGAQAWPPELRARQAPHASVTHRLHQYCKRLENPVAPGVSLLVGTQSLDSRWKTLTRYLPATLHARASRKPGENSQVNTKLSLYAHSWLLRHNMDEPHHFLKEFGRAFQEYAKLRLAEHAL